MSVLAYARFSKLAVVGAGVVEVVADCEKERLFLKLDSAHCMVGFMLVWRVFGSPISSAFTRPPWPHFRARWGTLSAGG